MNRTHLNKLKPAFADIPDHELAMMDFAALLETACQYYRVPDEVTPLAAPRVCRECFVSLTLKAKKPTLAPKFSESMKKTRLSRCLSAL